MQDRLPKNTPIDMDKWREIVDAWSKSGENQKAFCERNGLSLNTFGYARSKLLQRDKPKNQFIPLTVKNNDGGTTAVSSAIILENTRGYKLYLPASLSLDQFANLFKLSGWLDA